jgi:hypothetical protein
LERAVAIHAIQTFPRHPVQRRLSQIATSSSRVFANGEETEEEAANEPLSPPAGGELPASWVN